MPALNPGTREEEEEATRQVVVHAVSHRELPPQLDLINFITHGRRFPTRATDQQPVVVELDLREQLDFRHQQPTITPKPFEGPGASVTAVPSIEESRGRRCGPSSESTGRARGQAVTQPSQGANREPVVQKCFVSPQRRSVIIRPQSPPPGTKTRVGCRRYRTPPTKRELERGNKSHSLKPRRERDSDRSDLRFSLKPRSDRDLEQGNKSHSLKPSNNRDSGQYKEDCSLKPRDNRERERDYQSFSKPKRQKRPKLTEAANITRLNQSAREDELEQQRDKRLREQEGRIRRGFSLHLEQHSRHSNSISPNLLRPDYLVGATLPAVLLQLDQQRQRAVEPQPGISPLLQNKLNKVEPTPSGAVDVPIEVGSGPVESAYILVSTTVAAVDESEEDLGGVSDTLGIGVAEEEKALAEL